jgi:DNA-binding transcriptional LysR family regulator
MRSVEAGPHTTIIFRAPRSSSMASSSLEEVQRTHPLTGELAIPPFVMNDALLFASTVMSGSFTAAAERHGITPSGVSRALTRLERVIGVRLLVRTTRRLRMTEEGELFFESCREAIALMSKAAELASESSASLRGVLRIGLWSIVGTHQIVPLLPRLLAQNPHLTVQLVRVTSAAEFYSRQVDCALLPGEMLESSLAGRELLSVRMVLVATPGYIERHGVPAHPEALKSHHCITLVQPDGMEFNWLFSQPGSLGTPPEPTRIHGRVKTDDMEQVMASALAGLGIAQVPYPPLYHDIAAGRLVVLLEQFEPSRMPIWVVYSARRTLPKRLRSFVDFLVGLPAVAS